MNLLADLHKWYVDKGDYPVARHGGEPTFYHSKAVVEALKEIQMAVMMARMDMEPMSKAHQLLLNMLMDMAGFKMSDYTNECSKGGEHKWGIDGMHSNEFCKKCFRNKPRENV